VVPSKSIGNRRLGPVRVGLKLSLPNFKKRKRKKKGKKEGGGKEKKREKKKGGGEKKKKGKKKKKKKGGDVSTACCGWIGRVCRMFLHPCGFAKQSHGTVLRGPVRIPVRLLWGVYEMSHPQDTLLKTHGQSIYSVRGATPGNVGRVSTNSPKHCHAGKGLREYERRECKSVPTASWCGPRDKIQIAMPLNMQTGKP